MPLLTWKPGTTPTNLTGTRGRVQTVYVGKTGRSYNFEPGIPTYVEKVDQSTVTSKLAAISGTVTVAQAR